MGFVLVTEGGSVAFQTGPQAVASPLITSQNPLPTEAIYGPSNVAPMVQEMSGVGLSPWFPPTPGRPCNMNLIFSNGAQLGARLVRSFDGGQTHAPLTDARGNPVLDFNFNASTQFAETEASVLYAVEVYNYVSGTVTARISS